VRPNARDSGPAKRPVVLLTTSEDTGEAEALVEAVGFRLVGVVRQRRERPDPATFVGKGRLEEARARLLEEGAPLASAPRPILVVDAQLKPTVLFNLEDELKVEVWDRVRLILEIFQQNARVKEAQLQVELARLRYELPFVHEALHRQLTGEHPGFMGGGELAPRTYETHLKRRTKAIVQELERVKKERRTRRAGRKRSGLRMVTIAGYTNVGKSSLLNQLTASQVVAKQQVFSTLQTATRRLSTEYHPQRPGDLLFTDTVGFIRDLPPWLIDAFASTLEEITFSDAVLLVVDASEPYPLVQEKVITALQILERIHAPRQRVLVLNKADLVEPPRRAEVERGLRAGPIAADIPLQWTSTRTQEGLPLLVSLLLERVLDVRHATVGIDLAQPDHARLESWIRDHTDVLSIDEEGTRRRLKVRCPLPSWGKLLHRVGEAGGLIETGAST
jgi:GTPase